MPRSGKKKTGGLDAVRQQLSERLPSLLAKAAADHYKLASAVVPGEARDFAAYQSACKAALGHMNELIKMVRWAEGMEDAPSSIPDDPNHLIAKAVAALNAHPLEDEA